MSMDLKLYFEQYEALVQQADAIFEKVKQQHPQEVICKVGCSDCCHALFDLTLVEALYIKSKFDDSFQGEARNVLIERANAADRQIYKIKRVAYKEHAAGRAEEEILEDIALKRVRCPALNDDDQCALYEVRPLTCRLYGIPTVVGGKATTCGMSGFKKGESYPTVRLDAIYQKLYDISFALAQAIQTSYPKLAEMLVPLSMALLTDYTEEYLGVASETKGEEKGV